MADKKLNIFGIAIATVSSIASAFVLALLLGIIAALFGGFLMDSDGNIPIVIDGLLYILFVFPPFLIAGFIAALYEKHNAIPNALGAGICVLLLLLAMHLVFPVEETTMELSDYFNYIVVVPFALIGGWLQTRYAG